MSKKNFIQYAKKCLPLIDLTSLNNSDNDKTIKKLCEQAITMHDSVAAVCVFPQFVKLAKKLLAGTSVKIATVSNFPAGTAELTTVSAEIQQAILDGADEIDVVMPYQELLYGNKTQVAKFIKACREITQNHCLKIILETGELKDKALITTASELAIAAGADFIKTSTGKTEVGATFDAVETMLRAIAAYPERAVGLKISGGIRSVEQASAYMQLVETILGKTWISPAHFRIGASTLLKDVLQYL